MAKKVYKLARIPAPFSFLLQVDSKFMGHNRLEFDEDYDYYIIPLSHKTWDIRKVISKTGRLLITYHVEKRNGWYCDCPAGGRNINCKHILWVRPKGET